jgi:hypothetical protein
MQVELSTYSSNIKPIEPSTTTLLISWRGEFVVLVPAAEELAPAGAFGTGSVGSRAVDAPRASTRAVWLCSLAYLADARSGRCRRTAAGGKRTRATLGSAV